MGQVLPLVILGLFTAVAAAPWHGSSEAAFPLAAALLPAGAIHYWALRRTSVMPEIAILFSGLAIDIVSAGPLGLWVSVYAVAWLLGLLQRPWRDVFWKPGRWVLFSLSMGGLGLFICAIGELLGSPVASVGAVLQVTFWAIAAYPLLAGLLRLADGWRSGRPLESD